MLRSVKYGLYGAVLAGLVGGTVAWTNIDKTVHLVVDGQSSTIHTTAKDVGDVLAQSGYHAGAHDIVAPAVDTSIHDGSKIVYDRGRLLHLSVNGVLKNVWTTAPTVSVALSQLGYSSADFLSVSRSKRLPLSATDIAVRTPKVVTLVHDGQTDQVTTTDATVGQLLIDQGIALGPQDRLSPVAATALTDGLTVVLKRVRDSTLIQTTPIPFTTMKSNDTSLASGTTRVITPGRAGQAKITYAVVFVDGKLVGRTKVATVVVQKPTAKVIKVGTKPTAPNVSPVGAISAGSAQDIARRMVAARGWDSGEFACLVTLWNHESGWSTSAANPSGAYGIPQALPGSKMASAGPNWQSSATTQITWGLGYIASRYGTPCGAWSSWQSQGGWY